MTPPARTITVALDMTMAFDTLNIHKLARKILHTHIPTTIFKFIAIYIKGRKAYITFREHTSTQRQFKLVFPKAASSHPYSSTYDFIRRCHYHTIYTHQQNTYKAYIQPYLQSLHTWTKDNNLMLNPHKTTCTLNIQRLAE